MFKPMKQGVATECEQGMKPLYQIRIILVSVESIKASVNL